jgi:hypothetical protein
MDRSDDRRASLRVDLCSFRLLLVCGVSSVLLCAAVASPCRAAHPDDPPIKAAIDKGVSYLRSKAANQYGGYNALCVYAMLKAKVKASDPAIAVVLGKIIRKVSASGEYKPPEHFVYEAGVDLMALEAADAEKYRSQIEAIVAYLLKEQLPNGSWDYPAKNNNGDTSITQYAVLGLWAADRAGVKVPMDAWNRAANWYVKTQLKGDGGGAFAYHPAASVAGDLDRKPSHSMTAAGAGSLMVTRLFLHPNAKGLGSQAKKKAAQAKASGAPKFGVLQTIDFEKLKDENKKSADKPKSQKPEPTGARLAVGAIDSSVKGGASWLSRNYTIVDVQGLQAWPLYYLYGLERMCALAEIDKFGNRDWYADGSSHLVQAQKSDGSWMGQGAAQGATKGTPEGTAFAVLFLTKSTARILNKRLGAPAALGAGMQAGGRGLSGDLGLVEEKNGRVEQKKVELPIDQLLAELENPKLLDTGDAQKALVEAVQVGDREKLIGQKDRLKVLARHRDGEIRRTAFWALGRCEDLSVVPLLLEGLAEDDLGVMMEARNALCTLTRKPRGIFVRGRPLAANPVDSLPDTANEDQKKRAIVLWQQQVRSNWRAWYFQFRRYSDRDDLDELIFSTNKNNPSRSSRR